MCDGAHRPNMITCPNCGAGNKPGSSVCRMCAVSLEGVVSAPVNEANIPHATSAASANSNPVEQEEEKMSAEQQGIICPECGTSNEAGWSFCQQCGKRLPKSPQLIRILSSKRRRRCQRSNKESFALNAVPQMKRDGRSVNNAASGSRNRRIVDRTTIPLHLRY